MKKLFGKKVAFRKLQNMITSIIRRRKVGNTQERTMNHETMFPFESFRNDAPKFSGAFEPLQCAVNNSNKTADERIGILHSWMLRFMSSQDHCLYQEWIESLGRFSIEEKLEILLNEIRACGVMRDMRDFFDVEENTSRDYFEWDGTRLQIGDHVKVISPAWTLNGVCIEKGIIKKILL